MLRFIALIFLGIFLVSCSPQSQRQASLPTAAQLPTQDRSPTETARSTIQVASEQTNTPVPRATSASTFEPTTEVDNQLIFTNENNVTMEVERFEPRSKAGNYSPANGAYIVMFASLHNGDIRQRCVFARDVRLVLDGQEYAPQGDVMGAVGETLNPRRDYIGAILGQCFAANTTVPTFAVFDVPATFETASLTFYGSAKTVSSVWFDSPAEIVAAPTIEPSNIDQTLATDTLKPSATITDTPKPTVTITNTLRSTATITDTPRPTATDTALPPTDAPARIYYVTANANARECAVSTTTCSVVFTLSLGDELSVIEEVDGQAVSGSTLWYKVLYRGQEVYIHSSLLSTTKPVLAQIQEQPAQQAPVSTVPVPPPISSTWI